MVEKKTDSGPDFRLTRSRHPSASGRRIGPSAGDGWAARRDPKPKRGVFYDAGLYIAALTLNEATDKKCGLKLMFTIYTVVNAEGRLVL